MAENKQNSENKDTTENNKTTTGGAASTKPAREGNQATGAANNPTESAIGESAPQTSGATTGEIGSDVKETVGEVTTQAIGQAKEKATSVLGEQKTNLASGIGSVADSTRQVGENLGGSNENNQVAALAGKYGDTLAQQVERFSSYIDEREFREIARDVEQFARRNPLMFVGGAFALGVLAARFLKSSSNRSGGRRSGNNRSEKY